MLIASKESGKIIGNKGEQFVSEWLSKNGFIIVAHNFRTSWGEIDIIAKKKDILAFIEVKTRRNDYFNTSEVVTYTKQRKIIRTAKSFLLDYHCNNISYRFDVALIHQSDHAFTLTYLENAFTDYEE